MIIQTLQTNRLPLPHVITAEPLTRAAFAPFGSVVSNPAPGRLPRNAPDPSQLPGGARSANQGSAIQYRDLCEVRNLYRSAAAPRLTMFACGARELQTRPSGGGGGGGEKKKEEEEGSFFEVKILERHPYTTQTFCPLGVDPSAGAGAGASGGGRRYLVIVAPSIAPPPPPPPPSPSRDTTTTATISDPDTIPSDDAFLPRAAAAAAAAAEGGEGGEAELKRGFPDLRNLRAFVATGGQAVAYGPGTWHAPMVVLGPAGSAIDFVVTQFASGVDAEDCQEVVLRMKTDSSGGSSSSREGGGRGGEGEEEENDDSSGIWVRIPGNCDGDGSNSNSNKSERVSKL